MRQADAFRMNSPQIALKSDFLQITFGSCSIKLGGSITGFLILPNSPIHIFL